MNQLAHASSPGKFNSPCADLTRLAERELSAYFSAVTELYGAEEAELSVTEWLQELMESDGVPSSVREWRLMTAKVSTRLASRIRASSLASSSFMPAQALIA